MTCILGLSAGYHDAAISVVDEHGNILFAAHSERYSKIKNDPNIHPGLLYDISEFDISQVAYYEVPWLKQTRQMYSGQGIDWDQLTAKMIVGKQLGSRYSGMPVRCYNHHLSHAAAGFQTSPFDDATVVVIDAVGEWDTTSIWKACYDDRGQARYNKLWSARYPNSIGLFYTAMTQRLGLRPMEDEYVLMGMAAYSKFRHAWIAKNDLNNQLVHRIDKLSFNQNLHLGLPLDFLSEHDDVDLAGGTQFLAESMIGSVMERAQRITTSSNLVYMGGVALNCLANRDLNSYFKDVWIMPNPGDAGSSLGAAALSHGRKLHWVDAYLGHVIPGDYPVMESLDRLIAGEIVGIASGAAEFGPRALGNRSLLADPRGHDIKDRINDIKKRQKFRPFAPVILEELAGEYFETFSGSDPVNPYMQEICRCKYPRIYPAISHHDGTSRVQVVGKNSRSGIRQLLERWFVMTGCPMLLNTSLNIRGKPMVNDRTDADQFETMYGVKVLS